MSKKDVIIVESPSKIKTLQKFLGDEYIIEASVGHIRDLPKKNLGLDIDDDFKTINLSTSPSLQASPLGILSEFFMDFLNIEGISSGLFTQLPWIKESPITK